MPTDTPTARTKMTSHFSTPDWVVSQAMDAIDYALRQVNSMDGMQYGMTDEDLHYLAEHQKTHRFDCDDTDCRLLEAYLMLEQYVKHEREEVDG